MESSGTYGDCFRQAAEDAKLVVHRVSAKAVKDDSEGFDGVPSSHDGKDSAIIGTLCMNGRSAPWRWSGIDANQSSAPQSDEESSNDDAAIRYWVRRLDASQRIRQLWCGKLEGMLARHWPKAGKVLVQTSPTLVSARVEKADQAEHGDPVAGNGGGKGNAECKMQNQNAERRPTLDRGLEPMLEKHRNRQEISKSC
jgi:hypothetical protein